MPNGGEIFVSPELRQSLQNAIDSAQALLQEDHSCKAATRAAPIVFDAMHEARDDLVSTAVALNFCSACGDDACTQVRDRSGKVAFVCSDEQCWTALKAIEMWDGGWCWCGDMPAQHNADNPGEKEDSPGEEEDESGDERLAKRVCLGPTSVAGVARGTPPGANSSDDE